MIICRHFARRFVGKTYYKNRFGYGCGGRLSVLVRRFYNSGFCTGSVFHCVHCPHNFPQLVHLFLCQRRNGCALLIARNIRRKDRQDILPTNVEHIIVGCNVLAVVLYGIGDFFQPVAVFFGQGVYGFAHGDGRCVGGISGKENAVSRAGDKCHKATDDNNAKRRSYARCKNCCKAVQIGKKMTYSRAHRHSRSACAVRSLLCGKPYFLRTVLHLCLGCYAAHSFICGGAQLALTLGHAANVARRSLGGDGFLFRPLAGQICPTARALVCIGQRAVLGLFRADTALTGGGGAGSGFLLAVLSGLGFCQFPPLMPHKSCRLFRSRTYKICRFLLSEVIIIFPRGGAGLFFRFYPRRF